MVEALFAICIPVFGFGVLMFAVMSVKIIRPVEKALVERFGKFHRVAEPGLLIVLPFVENVIKVPTTEIRVDVDEQTVITKDNLNANVDAIVYYKIHDIMKAVYNIQDYRTAIPSLAQTTLRAVMGKMTLTESNENRQKINQSLEEQLDTETNQWGIDIIRVELQRIDPPDDVQQAMNNVVKAENEKIAAVDLATATETRADGEKRGSVKVAEGEAKAIELRAQARANAIKLVNEAAQKYFKGDAQTLKKLEVAEKALVNNTKYIIPEGTNLSMVISDTAGVVPIAQDKKKKNEEEA
ncbi:MAG: SPFH domain-containing protein [Candidatus Micrarchaeota archaeon]|nr:SPFH domain-containing protein [Candidatus Micrarchaeota archaeon]